MNGLHFIFVLAFALTGCADNRPTEEKVREAISRCSSSENCYLLDNGGNLPMLARSKSDKIKPSLLCGEKAALVEEADDKSDGSAIYRGQCEIDGQKSAQVTLWYFDDGRYNLTIEDCHATGCKNGWFRPI
ncbi:hypothetical protein GRI58_15095 [Porphyrobacter algicida]|uniref:Uncharacterized protein n=1 Tax=Qipengyuania algicida TaxID=1836209 RepID=A0A845AKJ4_9SPHN|nr:hypothetical protein [Qipengyuania algicida]MXP30134.1 hypothetical protein [Qipengyuania algicida]